MADNNITIKDAKLIFKNFRALPDKFDKNGTCRFSILLDEDTAFSVEFIEQGLNVKPLRRRNEEDPQMYHIPVKVNFESRRPANVVMLNDINDKRTVLDKDSIGILDGSYIKRADCVLNLYRWDVNGKTGVTAYLQTLYATIELDPIEAMYAED